MWINSITESINLQTLRCQQCFHIQSWTLKLSHLQLLRYIHPEHRDWKQKENNVCKIMFSDLKIWSCKIWKWASINIHPSGINSLTKGWHLQLSYSKDKWLPYTQDERWSTFIKVSNIHLERADIFIHLQRADIFIFHPHSVTFLCVCCSYTFCPNCEMRLKEVDNYMRVSKCIKAWFSSVKVF